jgi:hypothetical protein
VIGRVDGIVDGLTPLVEEIKTVEPFGRSRPILCTGLSYEFTRGFSLWNEPGHTHRFS